MTVSCKRIWSVGLLEPDEARAYAGLCADCRFTRVMQSDRGTVFYQCGKSFEDPAFAKFPRLPVLACPGYAPETKPRHPGE